MRGFRKLVMLGVLLVTLLLVIDTIDAGEKQGKKKELENGKSYDQENFKFTNKNKQTESIKHDKVKKTGYEKSENIVEENQYVSKGSRQSKKPDVFKNIKFASKEKKYTENGKTKTSKPFQKLKKSKVLQEEPIEMFDSSKTKVKKTKPQYLKSENVDKVIKTVKKTTQKKLIKENENVEDILNEELNRLKNEEIISIEETIGGNPKKRKYKLVEVVLEEDGQEEDQEGNETTIESGSEDQEFVNIESEEITRKKRSVHSPKFYKNKKSSKKHIIDEEYQNDEPASEDNYSNGTEETEEPEFNEGTTTEFDNFRARYTDPEAPAGACPKLPEDENRKGLRKLTLYVVEKEIDGEIRKIIVPEEDGTTICEVMEILQTPYNSAIIEE